MDTQGLGLCKAYPSHLASSLAMLDHTLAGRSCSGSWAWGSRWLTGGAFALAFGVTRLRLLARAGEGKEGSFSDAKLSSSSSAEGGSGRQACRRLLGRGVKMGPLPCPLLPPSNWTGGLLPRRLLQGRGRAAPPLRGRALLPPWAWAVDVCACALLGGRGGSGHPAGRMHLPLPCAAKGDVRACGAPQGRGGTLPASGCPRHSVLPPSCCVLSRDAQVFTPSDLRR